MVGAQREEPGSAPLIQRGGSAVGVDYGDLEPGGQALRADGEADAAHRGEHVGVLREGGAHPQLLGVADDVVLAEGQLHVNPLRQEPLPPPLVDDGPSLLLGVADAERLVENGEGREVGKGDADANGLGGNGRCLVGSGADYGGACSRGGWRPRPHGCRLWRDHPAARLRPGCSPTAQPGPGGSRAGSPEARVPAGPQRRTRCCQSRRPRRRKRAVSPAPRSATSVCEWSGSQFAPRFPARCLDRDGRSPRCRACRSPRCRACRVGR